jgi:hypothetical protein
MSQMRGIALQYWEMGLKPIPLCWPDHQGKCACPKHHVKEKSIGKAPLLGDGYQSIEVTEEKIEQWWTQWPQANIGILLEPSDLLVVDMDGAEAVREAHGRLPLSPTVISGNGEHIWYRNKGIYTRVTKQGKSRAIDILSKGYIIAPPSKHRNGHYYSWKIAPSEVGSDGVDLAEAPASIVNLLKQAIEKRQFPLPHLDWSQSSFPQVDVEQEEISNYLKRLIIEGDFQGKHPSRSEAQFEAINLLLYEGWEPEKIMAVLLDPAYRIGEKIQERRPGQAEAYASREIAKAQATLYKKKTPIPRQQKETDDNQITINISNQPIHVLSEQAWTALQKENHPPKLFVRNWTLTEIRMDHRGQAKLLEVSEAGLRGKLDRSAHWVRQRKNGDDYEEIITQPPLYVVKDMLVEPEMPLPPIKGITYTPIFSPDGTLETQPGYHKSSELYYIHKQKQTLPTVSSQPTEEEVKRAVDLLVNELFIDFPFKDQASRVHAIATLLLPFCRPMIQGPTPLHLIDAPKRGTGKSLLARAIHMIVTGMDASVDRLPHSDEETDKKISSILRDGRPLVVLDNASGSVERDSLNAVLTSTRYSGRLLGKSEMMELSNLTTWMMTGNNVDLTGDIHRRVCWIRLDAKMDKPYTRSQQHFQHPDLIGWIDKNRNMLMWAALTLIQHWIMKGKPPGINSLGSFESWSRTIGGILNAAGLVGFLGNQKELVEISDQEGLMWEAFLEKWWNEYGDTPTTAKELCSLAIKNEMLDSVLGGGNERSQKIKFGKELQRQRDLIYGDFCIHGKRDNHRKATTYWLKKIEN